MSECLLVSATRVDSQSPVTVTVEAQCGHRAHATAWTTEGARREAEAKLAVSSPTPRDPGGQTAGSSPAAEPSTFSPPEAPLVHIIGADGKLLCGADSEHYVADFLASKLATCPDCAARL